MQSLKLRMKRVRNNGEEDEEEDDSGITYGTLKEGHMIAVDCEDSWYRRKPISLLLVLNGKCD